MRPSEYPPRQHVTGGAGEADLHRKLRAQSLRKILTHQTWSCGANARHKSCEANRKSLRPEEDNSTAQQNLSTSRRKQISNVARQSRRCGKERLWCTGNRFGCCPKPKWQRHDAATRRRQGEERPTQQGALVHTEYAAEAQDA